MVDQLLANVEAESQTRLPARLHWGVGSLIELLPDVLLLLCRQARPSVSDPDPHRLRLQGEADLHGFRLWGEFEGIGQVIAEHLLQTIWIGIDQNGVGFGQVQGDEASWMAAC